MIVIDTETSEVREVSSSSGRRGGALGALGLLVRRRLWRDRGLFASSVLIVALATLLAYAGPELVRGTIDRGASDAVRAAGDDANILVTYPVGNPSGDNVNSVRGLPVSDFDESASIVYANLPPATAAIADGYRAWIESGTYTLVGVTSLAEREAAEAEDREPEREGRGSQYITFGYAADAELETISGAEPAAPPPPPDSILAPTETPDPIEIAITESFAEVFDLEVGDLVDVTRATGGTIQLLVAAVQRPVDPESPAWEELPKALEPTVQEGILADEIRRGTIITRDDTMAGITSRARDAFTGNVEIQVDPESVTLSSSRRVVRELSSLPQASDSLLPGGSVVPRVQTGLVDALEEYPAKARAALAQMSVVIAGVIAVASVVIALMAQLMLSRREGDLSLERARGASVTSIGLRLFVEALLFTAAGILLGLAAAKLLEPGIGGANGLANIIALVALSAGPILGVVWARRTWTGRREAANRQDRAKVRKAKAARRLTLDALAIVLAAVAVVTVRGRGVLQTQSAGIDPFLASAPVLIALAVVVVVVRLYPFPMRLVQAIAKRTRGVSGVITLAKARQSVTVLPLLSLTLAIAVAVSGGLLVSTVRSGQEEASWQRVGAEVRIEAAVSDASAEALEAQGLTVSRGLYLPVVTFALGSEYVDATLLAMDENYPLILEQGGVTGTEELRNLNAQAEGLSSSEPVPVLASQEFIDIDVYGRSELFLGRSYVPVDIIGPATVTPDGWAEGPYVISPLQPLLTAPLEEPVSINIAFVNGPGAAQAVAELEDIPADAVITREGWLAMVQDSALIGGVEFAMVLAVAAVAVLAGVGLLVTVLRGVRERGRALSMLRTQGMGSGWGWWLAFTELAPPAIAAVLGGVGAGVLIVYLLGGSLGLEVLSGGLTTPPIDINWQFMAAVGAGVLVLLIIAVAAEVIAHRRDRLSDVLRYGETR
jgi:putative ABC transport system permease protein